MILNRFTIRKMRGTFKINDFQPNVDYNNQPPQNPEKKGMAIAGIVCCAITLILTIINSVLGAYLGATGQLF